MRLCVPSPLCMLLVLFTFKAVDSYYGAIRIQCYFTRDLVTIELIHSWYFNKVEQLRYNSTTNRYTGFTDFGERLAESWNLNPQKTHQSEVYNFCKDNSDRYSYNVLKRVNPKVMVKSLTSEPDTGTVAVLMCSAYDYHPKGIEVSWLRNGKVISEGISSTDELLDGDWYYQIHSYLEYRPIPGEKISCIVEHESLTRPLIHTWDPALPGDERTKLIIGIFLLVLGIVLAVAGFLYYVLRNNARTGEQIQPPIPLATVSETSSEASNPAFCM